MSTIKNYLSLIKFSHTIFAMPFAMIGFFLGLRPYYVYGVSQWNLNKTVGWGYTANKSTETVILQDRFMAARILNITDAQPAYFIAVCLLLVILCMVFARS